MYKCFDQIQLTDCIRGAPQSWHVADWIGVESAEDGGLRDHLLMNAARFDKWALLGEELVDILRLQGAPTPMDMGGLGKSGKPQGGRGGGKGNTGSNNRKCYNCGKPRYTANQCRGKKKTPGCGGQAPQGGKPQCGGGGRGVKGGNVETRKC